MKLNVLKLRKICPSCDKKSTQKATPLSIINSQFLKIFLEINRLNQTTLLGIKIAFNILQLFNIYI
jgi:hypothetical protein